MNIQNSVAFLYTGDILPGFWKLLFLAFDDYSHTVLYIPLSTKLAFCVQL